MTRPILPGRGGACPAECGLAQPSAGNVYHYLMNRKTWRKPRIVYGGLDERNAPKYCYVNQVLDEIICRGAAISIVVISSGDVFCCGATKLRNVNGYAIPFVVS
jgi:hypothetical protein